MKKIFITIFLLVYLFSSVGYSAVTHFCSMRQEIVKLAEKEQCCDLQEKHSQKEEMSCCAEEEQPQVIEKACCSKSDLENSKLASTQKVEIFNNCCKEVELYHVVDNSIKNIDFKVEAVKVAKDIAHTFEKSFKPVLNSNSYFNPSFNHLNSPLLI